METMQFFNCRLIMNGTIVKDDLWVRNGSIINPEEMFYEEKVTPNFTVNCHNSLIAPGFIDTQINGGYGFDFSSDQSVIEEAVSVVRKNILSAGVTSFCPTIVTSPKAVYEKVLSTLKRTPGGVGGAEILGMHLEGPFINPLKKGAHPLEFILPLEGLETVEEVYTNLDEVKIITLAPELKNCSKITKDLSKRGIIVSVGHSNGDLTDGEEAMNSGATFITHLFNAMLPFHHRDPGLVGLLTSQFIPRPVFYGIIADGIHTHPAALRIAHKTHPKGLVLVTDAMAALGLGDGVHNIGQMEVEVKGRRAYLTGTKTLAGSIAPMDTCVRHFIKEANVSIVEGIDAASLHPAQLLRISHKKGTLNFGCDADFILIDDSQGDKDFRVLHTFIKGKSVYSADFALPLVLRKMT